MKGTLFSADFIKDSNDNLRLLELNTDTGIVSSEINNINLSDFINVLQTNNINELYIVYKPFIHSKLVEYISQRISTDALFITNVVLQSEDANTIYPTTIEDAENRFVLRMAYDESALFDSTYAKNRLNVFNLFTDSNITDYTSAYYYSSSEEGIKNTLTNEINDSNIPDATIKDIDEAHNPLDFFKIGSEVENETNEDRWNQFISINKEEGKVIEQYHFTSSSLSNNKLTSIRQISIVYSNDGLNVINLHGYKSEAIFDIPTTLSSEINSAQYTNKIGDNHYYEYTTNFVKDGSNGVLDSHEIIMADDSSTQLSDVLVGDFIKSYFISGSPQIESDIDSVDWSLEGSQFPSGSFITSSEVVFKEEKELKYGGIVQLTVDSDSVFVGVGKQFLVYDSGSNTTSYKQSQFIDPDTDYFFDTNGTLIDIDEANFYVTSDADLKFIELDVEDTDTYIISGSTSFHSIVTHNAPCFVAGTQITLEDGTFSDIENIKVGDSVLSFNFKTDTLEPQPVKGIGSKVVSSIVTYKFKDGSELKATLDHPLYCKKHGWVSMNNEYTQAVYNLTTSKVEVGCMIVKQDGSSVEIVDINIDNTDTIVYNIKTVAVNHNFYANEYLVHNRGCFIAGTDILLSNGDNKNIEDIQIGEEVLTYNEKTNLTEPGIVGEVKTHEVTSVIRLTLDNENIITTTAEHPFFVEGEWVLAGHLQPLDICIKSDGSESIVSTVEVLSESHTVYNLLSVSHNHNFFANGILVHNKL